ncbi:hypothetical protein Ngar_c03630 [Candidatus Nitrososphaera gargensis Ga9.2]|uniref:Uncharacterized protein n=1 Tax=Nitrososphaera gargensis (strain Ga9.2) TaxID=1237085 RepID=K0I7S2_NITGG|nr:hypothetical protein Ngar_c03630 [Candidatus Nitrososphaera gargensis Ga9.2]
MKLAKCKLCKKVHKGIGDFCPTCLRIKRMVRKIPKGQRDKIKRAIKKGRISIRRLLA